MEGNELNTNDGIESSPALTETAPSRTGSGYVGNRSQICIALQRNANHEQLTEWLSGQYSVNSIGDQSVRHALDESDLCIIDTALFQKYRDDLASCKRAAEPLFLPYLLVHTARTHTGLAADAWEVVDDIIRTPIRQSELSSRIEVLLRARRYSVDLKRQNDQLERYADIVSHDLRNPLTIAYGYLDSARQSGAEEAFDKVEHALGRMEQIIEDVLSLARTGALVEDVVDIKLANIAETAWKTVETKDATLDVRVEEEVTFRGDKTKIIELFENLFRNAVEHGGDDVIIRVATLDDGADGFYIEDNGDGIAEEERQKVFEYGYTTSSDGTGLGLPIVLVIAAAHEWTINLTDGQAGGARFELMNARTGGEAALQLDGSSESTPD